MDKKVALFAFNGDMMYFMHALLNALDMKERGYDVKLVIEGSATKQVQEMTDPEKRLAKMYGRAKEAGLIDCVCQACAAQTGALESAKEQNLPLCHEMSGHPSMARYLDDGYHVLVL